ncbi:MAG: WD40 repeat domain-containing serine/threonine protein kinase [Limisphaerales bacterium]
MDEQPRCPSCGAAMTGQAVAGMCANCLLALALDPSPASAEHETTEASDSIRPAPAADRLGEPDFERTVIGRYRLLEKLGEGGMGAVYLAEQREPVIRRVALKIIKLGMDTRAVVARFEAERQALAMMDHPNIAKVFDGGATANGRPYFVMELVEGVRITDYCDRERLGIGQRLGLFIQVCQAIQHAHQKGVIHRDIKPSNILVTLNDGQPVPKVIDFGIAKATEGRLADGTVFTQLHQFIGTPAYMSPEQAGLTGQDIDTRSDIYGLGVLLYELLTGRTPFDTKELMAAGLDAMRQVIREREPARPSTKLAALRPGETTATARCRAIELPRLISLLAGDLDWIVMKCLEKDRARRYETANGLAADLRRHLGHEPVVARPPSAAYRLQKAWRRHRLVFAAAVTVAAALAAGIGVSVVALLRARMDRTYALAAKQEAEAELWNSRLSETHALRIAGGPGARLEGTRLLRELSSRPGLSEAHTLALRRETIGLLALVDIAVPTNWVAKRPLALLGWDAWLKRFVRGAGSNQLELCEFPSGRVLASFIGPPGAEFEHALLTPDGQFLAARFGNAGGAVWVWRLDPQELVLRAHGGGPLELSPDSRSLLLLTSRGVVVQPFADATPWRLLQPGRLAISAAFSPDARHLAVWPEDAQHTVEVWDADSGEMKWSLPVDFRPERIAWHPDGLRLALGGDRGRLELRTLTGQRDVRRTGRPLPLVGHQGAVQRIGFSPDGSLLTSCAWDQSSILWDLISGRPLLREPRLLLSGFGAPGDRILALRDWPYSESVAPLVSRTGYRTVAWAGHDGEAHGVWLSPDGRLAAVAYGPLLSGIEGDCLLWDFRHGREIARLKGIWAAFSADSRTLHTFEAYQESRVHSYDVSEETLANPPASWHEGTLVYRGRAGQKVNTGALAADGRTLVIAATEAVIFLDTHGERPPRTWGKSAHTVSLSRDGRWIAAMLHHAAPVIWDTREDRVVFRTEPYGSLEFSPDSRWFSVATRSTVQIHALDTRLPAHPAIPLEVKGSAPPVAFSPDGRMFAVPLSRTQVRLHETASGRELATLSLPHPAPILGKEALKFSVDGQWLLAAKNDGETVAWNLPVVRAELGRLNLDWNLREAAAGEAAEENGAGRGFDYSGLFSHPPRDPSTPRELIDLSHHYNSTLTENWHPGGGASDLSELPRGVQTLAGTRFDLRGLIQVGERSRAGEPYPRQVSGIGVGLACRRLHFLHAAIMAYDLPAGTRIGSYVVRYADGQTHEIPIAIGRDVADWFSQEHEELGHMVVAWKGHNESSRQGGHHIRLFKTTWENPRPDSVIESLDFIATHSRACPFLVAVTAEPEIRNP